MGCDIHAYAEIRGSDGTWQYAGDNAFPANEDDKNCPFDGARDYRMFGFLADVRNYSRSPVIAEPRGVPDDASGKVRAEWDPDYDYHSASWLTLAELDAYDYDQTFWDRRITRQTESGGFDGRALAEEGEGVHLPLREFLGEGFFGYLDGLRKLGGPENVRIVFWFDS